MDEARQDIAALLDEANTGNGPIVIQCDGRVVGAVLGAKDWQQFDEDTRRRLKEIIDEIRRDNADRDPDEIYAEITQIVEEVRQERYDQQRRQAAGGS